MTMNAYASRQALIYPSLSQQELSSSQPSHHRYNIQPHESFLWLPYGCAHK